MEAVKFDLLTCFLYLMFGLLFLFSCRMAVVKQEFAGNQLKSLGQRRYGFSHMAVLFCYLLLLFFAVFRYISYPLGGTDATAYVSWFEQIADVEFGELKELPFYKDSDFLYTVLMYVVRQISANYHLLFVIVYGFILYTYYAFVIRSYTPELCFAPLIYVGLLFANSFNILRASIAIGFGYLGFLALAQKKNFRAVLFLLFSGLFHGSAFFLTAFFIFYWILSSKTFSKPKWVIFSCIGIYTVLFVFQDLFLALLRKTKYANFAGGTASLIGQMPTILCGILALVFFIPLKQRAGKFSVLVYAAIFDFCMIPLMLWYGFFRVHLFFTLPRLYVWSCLLAYGCEKLKISRRVGELVGSIAVIGWFLFRLSQDFVTSGIMPYYLEFLHP